jgi:hypothetical protein
LYGNVDVPTVDTPLTVGRHPAVPRYVDDGHHGIPVLTHEREGRLEVRAKRGRPGRFGQYARDYVGPASFDDLDHDLPDEVVLTGEVVADDAFPEEFLIAKAVAAFVPTLVIAYAVFGIFLAVAALFAHPEIVSAIYTGPHVLVQFLFTPLLAGWAIWVGIAVSTRSTDVRVAQQLSVLGSFPPLVIVALLSLNLISESTVLAIGFAAALLAFDLLAWRVVAAMFDRERLVTGKRG